MHIEASSTFIHLYKKLPSEIKEKTKKALSLLESNPHYSSLHHKKIAGQENVFEIRISKNYRLTYQRLGNTAFLRKVGTHNLLKSP